jgi:hypothetical protein
MAEERRTFPVCREKCDNLILVTQDKRVVIESVPMVIHIVPKKEKGSVFALSNEVVPRGSMSIGITFDTHKL